MEDWKKVNLVFKPEMYENEIMWKDHRKILGLNNRVMIGGGYLYIVQKSKKLTKKKKMNISEDLGTSIISIRYKIIFVGDVSVGKTSIMTRIVTNEFKDKYDVKIYNF